MERITFFSNVLIKAVKNNSTWQVKTCLEQGADPNSFYMNDKKGKYKAYYGLIHLSIFNNNYDIMNLLIDYGCSLEIKDSKYRTPLALAAFGWGTRRNIATDSYRGNKPDEELVHFLVAKGANIHATITENNITPTIKSKAHGQIKKLLENLETKQKITVSLECYKKKSEHKKNKKF